MRWCMAAHTATVNCAKIRAESRNGRVRGRGRTQYKQAFTPVHVNQLTG